MSPDIAASVRARLLNQTKKSGEEFEDARITVQLDIGVGDAVVIEPEEITCPTLLPHPNRAAEHPVMFRSVGWSPLRGSRGRGTDAQARRGAGHTSLMSRRGVDGNQIRVHVPELTRRLATVAESRRRGRAH